MLPSDLDVKRKHFIQIFLIIVLLPAQVSCSCDLTTNLMHINESAEDVVIKYVNYTLSNITWDMKLSAAGVSQVNATELKEYIMLNYTNTYLELTVVKALDKEELFTKFNVDIKSIILQMFCSTPGSQEIRTNLTLVIQEVNEFSPNIYGGPYNVTVKEDTPSGTTILKVNTTDPDVPKTSLIFLLKSTDNSTLGSKYLGFPQPSVPDMKLLKTVDYDKLVADGIVPKFQFLLNITDNNGYGRSNQTNITVVIEDVDDLPPVFLYPSCGKQCAMTQFRINITDKTHRGPLTVLPIALKAEDQDTLNYSITYSILEDQEKFHESFKINSSTGFISQVGDVSQSGIISVKAEEISINKHFATAVILVNVPETFVIPPAKSTAEDNSGGFLIGIIVLAIAESALISVVAVLIILHRKLKKQVVPFDGSDVAAKPLEQSVPKTTEVNEVKPIPRTNEIQKTNDEEEKEKETKEDTTVAENTLNNDAINNIPTPSQRNNLLDPIERSRESQKKRKKKKKKKDYLKKMGQERQRDQLENAEGQMEGDEEITQLNVVGENHHQIEALDGHFIQETQEIMV
ncbi:protocadherin gamma-B7-like [Saccostrea echinata]|uniref:protocadherin gamma-B7-like n=1 Tax=Saccostrea echinata TaxID=191078 RepID=UPI002A80B4FE|nr:protocadherin gamma-B7-like [Saccostrea echinata]